MKVENAYRHNHNLCVYPVLAEMAKVTCVKASLVCQSEHYLKKALKMRPRMGMPKRSLETTSVGSLIFCSKN